MLNDKDIEDCANWEEAKAKLESDSRFSDAPSEGWFQKSKWKTRILNTLLFLGLAKLFLSELWV